MRNECECEQDNGKGPIIVDQRAFDLGYICAKCGKNADNRVIGYLQNLGLLKIKKTSKRLRTDER